MSAFNKPQFKQTVLLNQSSKWSRATIWLILGLLASFVGWAYVSNLEQVISADGQLKPQNKVREVSVPVNGTQAVVTKVLVKEGQPVKAGDLLLVLDSTSSKAEFKSLQNVRQSLLQENKFYMNLMTPSLKNSSLEIDGNSGNIPIEIASLARNRDELLAENELLQAQLGNRTKNQKLTPQQLYTLQAVQTELETREAAARLKVSQLQKQFSSNQVQIKEARMQAQGTQQILDEIRPLVEEGGFSRLQYFEKEQQLESQKTKIEQLQEEQKRIDYGIEQAREELKNTTALTRKNILQKITENQQAIANFDSEINRRIVENKKKIAELDSQTDRIKQTLQYQEVRAPISGTIFEMNAVPGFIPNLGPSAAILKIVPQDYLIAEAYVTNKDIGFLRKGMNCKVRIYSFPYTEFGEITGKLEFIGSDALPPDNEYKFYRFPIKVKLAQQFLAVDNKKLKLQSGMGITIKIQVREQRTVFSLITEQLTRQIESIEQIK
ncbi:hemolysin D [Aphanothece hegewaldii CCALA 016]|uniref:Hemolysin D n=1 Tax=Aphanothece hegewaldii CCALA 016 TaxID=2107694 RepID=A0A2T1M411_9CHRO|nr:HlyD family efflux transporter periplasmic adaptor subunit [Aphanothece hegewaldii]PSF39490.1 hemolysin D [Aphanothece hegewaldii CCALA 016]